MTVYHLNAWDVGGQQVSQATHQFFLTKRSLYLLVWNACSGGESSRLDYWLNTIRAVVPDAPVLLLLQAIRHFCLEN
ncbi:MAG: hypothetical protein E6J34_12790 [Chloroflexi bacterium]|nr:MAG: hypothetical protein E6J34_12790 [Chloroflexota bacterium]